MNGTFQNVPSMKDNNMDVDALVDSLFFGTDGPISYNDPNPSPSPNISGPRMIHGTLKDAHNASLKVNSSYQTMHQQPMNEPLVYPQQPISQNRNPYIVNTQTPNQHITTQPQIIPNPTHNPIRQKTELKPIQPYPTPPPNTRPLNVTMNAPQQIRFKQNYRTHLINQQQQQQQQQPHMGQFRSFQIPSQSMFHNIQQTTLNHQPNTLLSSQPPQQSNVQIQPQQLRQQQQQQIHQTQPKTHPKYNEEMIKKRKRQIHLHIESNKQAKILAEKDAHFSLLPNFETPFKDIDDICERLTPFHVFNYVQEDDENDDKKVISDEQLEIYSNKIIKKTDKLIEKYYEHLKNQYDFTENGMIGKEEKLLMQRLLFHDYKQMSSDQSSGRIL